MQNVDYAPFEPPELLHGESVSFPADIYAYGILIYRLATMQNPWPPERYRAIYNIHQAVDRGTRPTIPKGTPLFIADLMQQCWRPAPSDRVPFEVIIRMFYHEPTPRFRSRPTIARYNDYCKRVFLDTNMSPEFSKIVRIPIKSDVASFEELVASADGGDVNAAYTVGRILAVDQENPANRERAVHYLERAASAIPAAALDIVYVYGRDRSNRAKALRWAQRAASDPEAIRARILFAELLGDSHPEVVEVLRPVVEQKVPEGIYLMGRYYRHGANQNPELSMKYLREAAALGHVTALNDIAKSQMDNKGDPAEILKNFERAANLGSRAAMYNLSTIYTPGSAITLAGVEQNAERAEEYLRQGADAGHMQSMVKLAQIFLERSTDCECLTVEYLLTESARLFKRAADLGNPVAQLRYGELCLQGINGVRSVRNGMRYLLMAAQQRSGRAMRAMAAIFEKPGNGLPVDQERARKLRAKAAEVEAMRRQPSAV
jgi:TPR repeat protein